MSCEPSAGGLERSLANLKGNIIHVYVHQHSPHTPVLQCVSGHCYKLTHHTQMNLEHCLHQQPHLNLATVVWVIGGAEVVNLCSMHAELNDIHLHTSDLPWSDQGRSQCPPSQ